MIDKGSPIRPLFEDPELEKEFSENGYVRLPLVDEDQIKSLEQIYNDLDSGVDLPFYTSIWSSNRAFRQEVDRRIKQILLPILAPLLVNCKPVFANLMVKQPSPESEIGLHQDWTLVDESRFRAINVWIPLVDSNQTNGSLQIVKRSHLFTKTIRGRNMRSPYEPIQSEIKKAFLTSLSVNAGEAVIFDERLLHCSQDNKGKNLRLATSIVMIPEEAQMVHFVAVDTEATSKYRMSVNPSFFTEYGLFDDLTSHMRNGECLPFDYVPRNLDSFVREYNQLNNITF